jgi:phosphatidylinositol phospholipase C delta
MINHAMFQRNGRSGYVLKPLALRSQDKSLLNKQTRHYLDITVRISQLSIICVPRTLIDMGWSTVQVISAQQLPLPKDANGHEIVDKPALNPYVEVSVHFPDWGLYSSPPSSSASGLQVSNRTSTVKNNGFNPIWEEMLSLPFHVLGDMRELVFVRFAVREDGDDDNEALAVHCVSLACLREGMLYCDISILLFWTDLFVGFRVPTLATV